MKNIISFTRCMHSNTNFFREYRDFSGVYLALGATGEFGGAGNRSGGCDLFLPVKKP